VQAPSAGFAQGLVDTDTCPQAPARSAANTWALVGYFFEGCLAVWLFKARPARRHQGGGAVPRMLENLWRFLGGTRFSLCGRGTLLR